MFRGRLLIACALAGALGSGSVQAAPEFLRYEGRDAIHEGRGGERKTVEGVDFWMRGDPPHRFEVLGSISDRRHKTGIYGAIRMSGLDADVAKAAKAAGGDAVILDEARDEVTGISSSAVGSASGSYGGGSFEASGSRFGIRRAIQDHESRYIVVRYLPDEPKSASTPPPSAPDSH
jgi:hypothetical protein